MCEPLGETEKAVVMCRWYLQDTCFVFLVLQDTVLCSQCIRTLFCVLSASGHCFVFFVLQDTVLCF